MDDEVHYLEKKQWSSPLRLSRGRWWASAALRVISPICYVAGAMFALIGLFAGLYRQTYKMMGTSGYGDFLEPWYAGTALMALGLCGVLLDARVTRAMRESRLGFSAALAVHCGMLIVPAVLASLQIRGTSDAIAVLVGFWIPPFVTATVGCALLMWPQRDAD